MAIVTAILRDPDTGDACVYSAPYPYEAEVAEFYWTEGNMSCDCNKRLILRRANLVPEEREGGHCGDRILLDALFYGGERIA